MYSIFRNIILGLLFLVAVTKVQGQLNFISGYTAEYMPMESVGQMFEQFNEDRPWLDQTLKENHFFHGVTFGVRYQGFLSSIEAYYNFRLNPGTAQGIIEGTSSTYKKELDFKYSSISLGTSFRVDDLSIGVLINRDKLSANASESGKNLKRKIMEEQAYSSTFFIDYKLGGTKNASLAIRPFYTLPWGKMNVKEVGEDLSVDVGNTDLEYQSFGIKLLICNGRQER